MNLLLQPGDEESCQRSSVVSTVNKMQNMFIKKMCDRTNGDFSAKVKYIKSHKYNYYNNTSRKREYKLETFKRPSSWSSVDELDVDSGKTQKCTDAGRTAQIRSLSFFLQGNHCKHTIIHKSVCVK